MSRKKQFAWITVLCVIVCCLLLVGCSASKGDPIPVPKNLAIDNDVLTWDAVTGAIGYDVLLDGTVYEVEDPYFDLPIYDTSDHEIAVRVITRKGMGAYSATVVYAKRETVTVLPQLPVPYGITMTSNRVIWNSVLNNNGYKIFFDGQTYLTDKNATYFDLTFTRDGTFYVKMQTIGDGRTYASSNISSPYAVTVRNLTAPLQKLPKTEFVFNPETKELEWTNLYSAAAVSYEIYRDEISSPLAVIDADSTKTKMSYRPILSGSRVSYTMRLISNNGLYSSSEFGEKITFPIADAAPASLTVAPNVERNGYYIEWSTRKFTDGYVVEIDGEEYPAVTDNYMKIPTSLEAGRHVVRVRTNGDSVYYADSLLSGGVAFRSEAGGKLSVSPNTPQYPTAELTAAGIRLTVEKDKNVDLYGYTLTGKSGSVTLYSADPILLLSATECNGKALTEEDALSVAAIFEDLALGVTVSVTAHCNSDLYGASASSEEVFLCSDGEVPFFTAPTSFAYRTGRFDWNAVTGAEKYELIVDGERREITDTFFEILLSSGAHSARVRALGENAMWSEELFFLLPYELAAPSDLKVSAGELTFTGSENALGYRLYANGAEVGLLGKNELAVKLSGFLKTDGSYLLTIVAVGDESYTLSPPSEQYLYVKTDAEYGTSVKPYLPLSGAELLSVMRQHPSAYVSLSVLGNYDLSEYDFSEWESFSFKGVPHHWMNLLQLTKHLC